MYTYNAVETTYHKTGRARYTCPTSQIENGRCIVLNFVSKAVTVVPLIVPLSLQQEHDTGVGTTATGGCLIHLHQTDAALRRRGHHLHQTDKQAAQNRSHPPHQKPVANTDSPG